MNILFLSTVYPAYERTGGDIASFRYVRGLRELGHDVDLLTYLRQGDPWPTADGDHIAGERLIETSKAGAYAGLWMLRSLLAGVPYSAGKYRSSAYLACLRRLRAEKSYELIVLDHCSRLAWVLPSLRLGPSDQTPLVCISHNVEYRLYENQQRTASSPWMKRIFGREARLVKQVEDDLALQASEIWTLTPDDQAYYAGLERGCPVRAFPTPPRDDEVPPATTPKHCDIGLIGNWEWGPNAEGLKWFADAVVPLLPPSVGIRVAGRGAAYLAGRYPNLAVMGYVPDANLFMAEARVIAVPSTAGGGVQIKTLDSIALGLPVVATPFALRGIASLPPTVRCAESAPAYAAALLDSIASGENPAHRQAALDWATALRAAFREELSAAVNAVALEERAS